MAAMAIRTKARRPTQGRERSDAPSHQCHPVRPARPSPYSAGGSAAYAAPPGVCRGRQHRAAEQPAAARGAARRARAQAEESLRVARARVQAGATPEFDMLQADVAVAGAWQGLVRAQTAAQSAQAELNALLNLPLATSLEPTDTLEPRPVPGTLEAAIARAMRARPELIELRARMDAARAAIDLAASGARPNVVLGAYYDVGGSPRNLSGTGAVVLAVTLSLSDGGITRERIREAELRLEQLKVLEAQTKQRIELEARQAWPALGQGGGGGERAGRGGPRRGRGCSGPARSRRTACRRPAAASRARR